MINDAETIQKGAIAFLYHCTNFEQHDGTATSFPWDVKSPLVRLKQNQAKSGNMITFWYWWSSIHNKQKLRKDNSPRVVLLLSLTKGLNFYCTREPARLSLTVTHTYQDQSALENRRKLMRAVANKHWESGNMTWFIMASCYVKGYDKSSGSIRDFDSKDWNRLQPFPPKLWQDLEQFSVILTVIHQKIES